MTISQIAELLERIGGIESSILGLKDDIHELRVPVTRMGVIEGAVAQVRSELTDLKALVVQLENARVSRVAVDQHSEKSDARRRSLLSLVLSAAGVGASVATAVYVILHASRVL